MQLGTLASTVPDARLLGDTATPVSDLAYDSRAVTPGCLFFCVPGRRSDGHAFAEAALGAGAFALVVERQLPLRAPQVVVPSVRGALGPMSAEFFGHPSRALALVGVTGTNGKTTSTYMLGSVFDAAGWRSGLIGNIERRLAGESLPVDRNTPEAPDLQRLLAQMREAEVRGVAMEVTSEGIAEGRVAGTRFACAVFTNLTQDHLNYHGTMEAYFQAKAQMFEPEMSVRAAINIGDAYGRRLREAVSIPVTTFGAEDADAHALSVRSDARGSEVVALVGAEEVSLRVPLAAGFNVTNALGVLAAASAVGIDAPTAARGIASLRGVGGRLERVDAGQPFTVLVDYAHTPDSLENVLQATREITPPGNELIVVFGCGGDRDRGKRPLMGTVAASLADHVVITSDNPRSEDPLAIIAEIEAGTREGGAACESVADRREAIARALRRARARDVVVIAGKGHETGQEFADRVVPFDDRVVAREELERL